MFFPPFDPFFKGNSLDRKWITFFHCRSHMAAWQVGVCINCEFAAGVAKDLWNRFDICSLLNTDRRKGMAKNMWSDGLIFQQHLGSSHRQLGVLLNTHENKIKIGIELLPFSYTCWQKERNTGRCCLIWKRLNRSLSSLNNMFSLQFAILCDVVASISVLFLALGSRKPTNRSVFVPLFE